VWGVSVVYSQNYQPHDSQNYQHGVTQYSESEK